MIPRYTRKEMAAIWAPEQRLRLWLEIELCALEAMAEIGRVPLAVAAAVRAAADERMEAIIDPAAIEAIEATTRHDVIAFLSHVEQIDRARSALPAPRPDLLGPARHGARSAAHRGRRPPARGPRPFARRPEAARARAQGHALHRPLARHSRRAHHVRAETRRLLRRVRAQPPAPGASPRRGRHLRALGRRRHVRQRRARRRGAGRGSASA